MIIFFAATLFLQEGQAAGVGYPSPPKSVARASATLTTCIPEAQVVAPRTDRRDNEAEIQAAITKIRRDHPQTKCQQGDIR